MKLLIKLGGTLLDAAESRERLAREIAAVAGREQVVVVHGGGKQMTRFLAERGIESRFMNGLRVTTEEVIDAVVKVFAGSVNARIGDGVSQGRRKSCGAKRLERQTRGCSPTGPRVGVRGKAGGMRWAVAGRTGESRLPSSGGLRGRKSENGEIFNVNGDQMAAACAQGFGAERLIFLTDVEGVRDASVKFMVS